MLNDTSVAVKMVEEMTEECVCEDPLQGYMGEPLITCPVCCQMCSEAAAEAALDEVAHIEWLEERFGTPPEGDTSWLDQYMC